MSENDKVKLPRVKAGTPRRETNAWMAADRAEKMKAIATIVVVVLALAAGLWLIIAGLSG